MKSNFERFKKDLDDLISKGERLHLAIQRECFPEKFARAMRKEFGDQARDIIDSLPYFADEYQAWYSEALVLVKQLLPDRLADFIRYYEKPKRRKSIDYENYRIEDYLQNLIVTRGGERIVGPKAAIPHFRQQLAILKSAKRRFESSLFDIRQLVQADLFDSELEAAKELLKHKFLRAAGALAGVVLERHLRQVCDNHGIKVRKKSPTIADLNKVLKENEVIEIVQWRYIQHLADIRNLCTHDKKADPTLEQVVELIDGVAKVTKTVF